jgi:cell division protein ZapE
MTTPLARYERQLTRPGFQPDPAQRLAVEHLEALYRELLAQPAPRHRWWPFGTTPAAVGAPRGLYLWGSVGRGKTLLVDMFFDCLPPDLRKRQHFHSFMRAVHAELKALPKVRDPLAAVARKWAGALRVLCLDEFHVTDITDAMLLARLLKALFDGGVVLVTTSNDAPDMLYRGGLQRERFVPAIELLKQRLVVLKLGGAVDFRLRTLEQAAVYFAPDDGAARATLAAQFEALTGVPPAPLDVDIEGRPLPVRGCADGVIWCEFADLCGGPRGTLDYIELGRCFHTLILSGVPALGDDQNDAVRRFINLLDELYDRNVNLLVSAEVPPAALYRGARLVPAFRRTVSRLSEMQSHEYLSRPHISI